MALFVRKSFRAGPVRLNLSKSGLGVSAGFKGARIGTGPRGAYVHAGRKGLYYRKNLGSKTARKQVETGSYLKLICYIVAAVFVFYIIRWFVDNPALFFFLLAIGVIIGGAIFYTKFKREKNLKNYKRHLDNCFLLNSEPLDENSLKEIAKLKSIIEKDGASKVKIIEIEKNIYEALLDKILDDKVITAEEKKYIEIFEKLTTIDDSFKDEVKVETFRAFYLEAIADHEITKEEINTLNNFISGLNINKDLIQDELLIVKEILRMQKLSLPLSQIESPPVKIQKSEKVYYADNAKVLTRKKAKKSSDSEYEYTVKRDGKFVVTNKRALLVDQGTTSVNLKDIVDVDIDLDNKSIVLSKSTSSVPVFIQSHEPLYVGRIIDLLSQE